MLENEELKRVNEILGAVSVFNDRELDAWHQKDTSQVIAFIDDNRCRWVGQLICRVLQFALPTYYAAKARSSSARAPHDKELHACVLTTDGSSSPDS